MRQEYQLSVKRNTFSVTLPFIATNVIILNNTSNLVYISRGNTQIPTATNYDYVVLPSVGGFPSNVSLPTNSREFAGFLPLSPTLLDLNSVVTIIFTGNSGRNEYQEFVVSRFDPKKKITVGFNPSAVFVYNPTNGYAYINVGSNWFVNSQLTSDITIAPYSYYNFTPYEGYSYSITLDNATVDYKCIVFFVRGYSENEDFFFVNPSPEIVVNLYEDDYVTEVYPNTLADRVAVIHSDGNVRITQDFQSVSPTWISHQLPTFNTTNRVITKTIIDSYSAFYINGSGDVNCYIVCANSIYKLSDIFGTRVLTTIFTLPNNNASIDDIVLVNGSYYCMGRNLTLSPTIRYYYVIKGDSLGVFVSSVIVTINDEISGSMNPTTIAKEGSYVSSIYGIKTSGVSPTPNGVHVGMNDSAIHEMDGLAYSLLKSGNNYLYTNNDEFYRNGTLVSLSDDNSPRLNRGINGLGNIVIVAGTSLVGNNHRCYRSVDNGDSFVEITGSLTTSARTLCYIDGFNNNKSVFIMGSSVASSNAMITDGNNILRNVNVGHFRNPVLFCGG